VLEQRVDLTMGPVISRYYELREPSEQGHDGGNVLACPNEVWETDIVLDDPPIYVMGHGARTLVPPTLNLVLELCALLL
jgi:hypothetical protein